MVQPMDLNCKSASLVERRVARSSRKLKRYQLDFTRARFIIAITGRVSRLTTSRLDTTNHSDRCLEAFHCSNAVSGSCPINSSKRRPPDYRL